MKIIIQDFKFKGEHYDEFELDMPNVENIEGIPEDKIIPYVMEELEILLKEDLKIE